MPKQIKKIEGEAAPAYPVSTGNQPSAPISSPRLLRMRDLRPITTYSKASIYRLIALGQFPKPLKLGPARVAWLEHEVAAWIKGRQAAA